MKKKPNINQINSNNNLANDFEDLEKELDQLCEDSFKNKPPNNLKNPYEAANVELGQNGKVNLNK